MQHASRVRTEKSGWKCVYVGRAGVRRGEERATFKELREREESGRRTGPAQRLVVTQV